MFKAHTYGVVECGYHILKTKNIFQDESKWEHPEPHIQVDTGGVTVPGVTPGGGIY